MRMRWGVDEAKHRGRSQAKQNWGWSTWCKIIFCWLQPRIYLITNQEIQSFRFLFGSKLGPVGWMFGRWCSWTACFLMMISECSSCWPMRRVVWQSVFLILCLYSWIFSDACLWMVVFAVFLCSQVTPWWEFLRVFTMRFEIQAQRESTWVVTVFLQPLWNGKGLVLQQWTSLVVFEISQVNCSLYGQTFP